MDYLPCVNATIVGDKFSVFDIHRSSRALLNGHMCASLVVALLNCPILDLALASI